jgi:hypothetical protein
MPPDHDDHRRHDRWKDALDGLGDGFDVLDLLFTGVRAILRGLLEFGSSCLDVVPPLLEWLGALLEGLFSALSFLDFF